MPETAPNYEALIGRALDLIPEIFPGEFWGATQWQPAGVHDEDANFALVFLRLDACGSDVGDCQFQLMTHVLDEHHIPILAQGIRNRTGVVIVNSEQVEALTKLASACNVFGTLIKFALRGKWLLDGEFLMSLVTSEAALQKQSKRGRK